MDEPAARKIFESNVPQELFTVHRECVGRLELVKPIKHLFISWGATARKKGVRIDYVLEPTAALKQLGWELGCIGVEAKKGGSKKHGRALSQLFDYQCATFRIPSRDEEQPLSMIFLLQIPHERFSGIMASVMMQEGLGVVRCYEGGSGIDLLHGNGMHPILGSEGGKYFYRRPRFGLRSGSR